MVIDKHLVFKLLRPLSPLYSWAMRIREKFYQRSIFQTHAFNVPVISVGNLTMGGTGKTPLVICLAKRLSAFGLRPAVISRGYRGKATGKINVVSDGREILLSAQECGDEPRLIAENLRQIPVLTGKKRKYPCQYAIEQFGCNVLVLDDAFQHLSVKRDLDLVLFSADTISEPKHVFPGGELRESFSALNRCDAIIYTGVSKSSEPAVDEFTKGLESLSLSKKSFVTRLGRPLFYDLQTAMSTESIDPSAKVLAFCGIGNPDRFRTYLKKNNILCSYFKVYPDHHTYSEKDIEELEDLARQHGATFLLTTEKDKVKLGNYRFQQEIRYVIPEMTVDPAFDSFVKTMLDI